MAAPTSVNRRRDLARRAHVGELEAGFLAYLVEVERAAELGGIEQTLRPVVELHRDEIESPVPLTSYCW